MGTEFAQFREWDYENALEWFILDYSNHRAMREYTAALNRFYLKTPALWELDFDGCGFEWIMPDLSDINCVAYKRIDAHGNFIVVAINFSGVKQTLFLDYILEAVFETEKTGKIERTANGSAVTLNAFSGIVMKEKENGIKINIRGDNN